MRVRFQAPIIASIVAGALLLSGCGSTKVSEEDLAEQIKTQLTEEVGQEPDSVECSEGLDAEVGATQRCVLTAGSDELGVTATVTSVDGSTVNYDIKVDEMPAE